MSSLLVKHFRNLWQGNEELVNLVSVFIRAQNTVNPLNNETAGELFSRGFRYHENEQISTHIAFQNQNLMKVSRKRTKKHAHRFSEQKFDENSH